MKKEYEPVAVKHEHILGGRPTFRGTRVQIETLFENLAEGYSLDEIIENFPTLDREDMRLALFQACELLKKAAPDTTDEPSTTGESSHGPVS
jgi:uncharacterized protein (DUF433 family)